MKPTLIILAGPNGAGKSTFYKTYLEQRDLPFINADVIAKELQMDAYQAANLASNIREGMLERKESFIFETVFSDTAGAKLEFMKRAATEGYHVVLFFIGVASVELSKARVGARHRAGGHDVPEEKLRERYARTLINLTRAVDELPTIFLYDNSQSKDPFRLVAEFRNGVLRRRGIGPVPEWMPKSVII